MRFLKKKCKLRITNKPRNNINNLNIMKKHPSLFISLMLATPLSSLYNSLFYAAATSTEAGAGVRIDIAAIYVPASSVNAYKIAWPDYASVIRAKP